MVARLEFEYRRAGKQSAIQMTVRPIMAGKYFDSLARQLEKHRDRKDYTISKAHFDAIQDLERMSESETAPAYGPKALIYSMLGNGSLRLCPLSRNKSKQ